MRRIVCVGNRYAVDDAAGPLVYDCLAQRPIPPDIEIIDGGLGGLDLLRYLEWTERVVFVDAVSGQVPPDGVTVLTRAGLAEPAGLAYEHSAGLDYLLRAAPLVCAGPLPEILVVGIEGTAGLETIRAAADLSLAVASSGYPAEGGRTWH